MTPLSPKQWQAWLVMLRLDPMGTVGDISIDAPHEWCDNKLALSAREKLGFHDDKIITVCTRHKSHKGPHCDGILDDYKMITWTSAKQYKGIK